MIIVPSDRLKATRAHFPTPDSRHSGIHSAWIHTSSSYDHHYDYSMAIDMLDNNNNNNIKTNADNNTDINNKLIITNSAYCLTCWHYFALYWSKDVV